VIEIAIICGLFGYWLWSVLNDEEGAFGFVTRFLSRWEWTSKWLKCPYCSGAWFAIIPSLILFHPSFVAAVVTAFAAAAITGLLGSNF
jgi:hypothetical protein